MTDTVSVQNEQIIEKASQLYSLFQAKLKLEIPAGLEEDQFMICQEMLFYSCEHGIPATGTIVVEDKPNILSVSELWNFAEELYLVAFIFWGNTNDRITPFFYLDAKIKEAFLAMASTICEWYAKGELPHAEEDSSQTTNGQDSK